MSTAGAAAHSVGRAPRRTLVRICGVAVARRGLAMLICLVGLAAAGQAHGESFRCGGSLIQTGDPAIAVRNACGEPSFVDPWIGGSALAYGVAPSMEEWTYNRGPSRLLQILVFRDGELYRIRSDGYGFRETSGPASCRPMDIARGMSKYRLLRACGEPAQRRGGVFVYSTRGRAGSRDYYLRRGAVPVYRERWIFNFGDNRLLREVVLENAMVVETDTLQRGFDE